MLIIKHRTFILILSIFTWCVTGCDQNPDTISDSGIDGDSVSDSDEQTDSDGDTSATGSIEGIVFAPNETGFDVVPEAHIRIESGPETYADELGRFSFEGLEAGRQVTINVSGPESENPDNLRIYSTNQVIETITAGETSEVFVYLLSGCVATVNGETGGTLSFEECGGSGTASLSFEPHAFVDEAGELFDGQVRVEVSVVNPQNDMTWATIAQGSDETETTNSGALEVRLKDAQTMEELSIAEGHTVRTRFEILEAAEEDLEVQWYNTESHRWETVGTGTVIEENGQYFYEFGATHFTSYRAKLGFTQRDFGCITMTPRICRNNSCDRVSVVAEVLTRGYYSRHRLNWERTCIVVPDTPTHVVVRLHTMDPGLNYASRVFGATVNTGNTEPACCNGDRPIHNPECECDDLGNIDLIEMTLGCITGTLQSGTNPMHGRISIRAAGAEISMLRLLGPNNERCQQDPSLPECNGEFCANLPMRFFDPDTEIEFVDPAGNSVSVTPDVSSEGEECGVGFCQQIGSPQPVCTHEFGCVSPGFTHRVIHDSPRCPSVRPHEIQLDGSLTLGQVTTYQWTYDLNAEWVDSLTDPSEIPGFLPARMIGPHLEQVSVCVEPGKYDIKLEAFYRASPNYVLSNSETQTISAGLTYPGPCEASYSVSSADYYMTYSYNGDQLDTIIQTYGSTSTTTETFDVEGRLIRTERDYSSKHSTYIVINELEYWTGADCLAEDYCDFVRRNDSSTVVDGDSYASVSTFEYSRAGNVLTQLATSCPSDDPADCEGDPPIAIPAFSETEYIFNPHGQIEQIIVPGYSVTTYTYVSGQTDPIPRQEELPFVFYPRPRFWPMEQVETTYRAGTWARITMDYGDSENIQSLEFSASDGSSAASEFDYSCW